MSQIFRKKPNIAHITLISEHKQNMQAQTLLVLEEAEMCHVNKQEQTLLVVMEDQRGVAHNTEPHWLLWIIKTSVMQEHNLNWFLQKFKSVMWRTHWLSQFKQAHLSFNDL